LQKKKYNQVTFYFVEEGPGCGSADIKKEFNVLLTVYHAMILGNCPTWCTNSLQCIYLFI